ncbi:MAG: archaeosortase/exosortase family protein [Telluria sp.]
MTEEFNTQFQIAFFSTVGLLLLLERVGAWRRASVGTGKRWTSNIGLLVFGSVLAGLIVPLGLVGFANTQPPGLMARLGWPMAVQIVATFLALDLYHYWQHRLYHHFPLLWRLHLVHHSDTQVDVTTTERHHPLESILGTGLLLLIVYAFGLPAAGVGIYLLVATVVTLYSHANLHPPLAVDRLMRRLIVTAPLHAVHHSDLKAQTDSNFALVLPIWDRWFGTYVDPEHAPVARFGLEYFHQPRDTGLGRVLLQPFLYRQHMHYPARTCVEHAAASPAPPALTLDRHWDTALRWGLAGFMLAALALWPTVSELARLWTGNEAYQYGWLVMPMVIYLLGWHRRQEILSMTPQPGFAGVLVAIAGAALWAMALVMNIDVGRHVALVVVLQGVAMALLGWRAYWRLFPVLALLFFMVPAGDVLQPFLRSVTIKSIELFAALAGIPHRVDGYVIHIGSMRYIVVEQCTGLSYVTLAAFLCYSLGSLLYESFRKVAALAVLGALLGIFSNTVRVNSIVLADWLRGTQMPLSSHGAIQWAALMLTLGLVFFLLSRLATAPAEPASSVPPMPRRVPRFHVAPLLAGLSVLATAGVLRIQTTDLPRLPGGNQVVLAQQDIQGWKLAARPAGWAVDQASQSESIDLFYRRDGQVMRARVIRALAPATKLSGSYFAPDRKSDWHESGIEKYLACAGSHCVPLVHATWRRGVGKDRARHDVFYNYGIGQDMTDSKLLARALIGWHRITGNADAPYMIGLIFENGVPAESDVAGALEAIRSAVATNRSAQGNHASLTRATHF